jgi:hypothetical protein
VLQLGFYTVLILVELLIIRWGFNNEHPSITVLLGSTMAMIALWVIRSNTLCPQCGQAFVRIKIADSWVRPPPADAPAEKTTRITDPEGRHLGNLVNPVLPSTTTTPGIKTHCCCEKCNFVWSVKSA